jgi:hypothetical protein
MRMQSEVRDHLVPEKRDYDRIRLIALGAGMCGVTTNTG